MSEPYTPADWFWIVGGDTSQAFSSADFAYVQEWNTNRVTAIDSFESLRGVLMDAGVIPPSITRRQCALELLERTLIDAAEAKAMTRAGTPPAMVQTMIDALSTQADRDRAEIDFAADTYMRSNPLLIALMTGTGATAHDIDVFFCAAAER